MQSTVQAYTVKQIASRFGVGVANVLAWIDAGELGALNVAAATAGRPRWRIRNCDVLAFELRRSNRPAHSHVARRHRPPAGNVPHRF